MSHRRQKITAESLWPLQVSISDPTSASLDTGDEGPSMDMLPEGFELLPEEGEIQQLEAEIFADGTDAFDQLETDDGADEDVDGEAVEPAACSDELTDSTDAEEAVVEVVSRTRNLGDELDDEGGLFDDGLEFDAEEGLIRPEMDLNDVEVSDALDDLISCFIV